MAYHHGRSSVRDAYEDHFMPLNSREVTLRVVNIIDKRNYMPRPGQEYDGGYEEDQWYEDPRHCHYDEAPYPHADRHYYDGNPNFGNFRRHSPPHRNEAPYPSAYGRDDLRHHLSSRKNRSLSFRSRGRGSGPPPRPGQDRNAKEDRDYRNAQSIVIKRDRSPAKREGSAPTKREGPAPVKKEGSAPSKREGPAPATSRSSSSSNRSVSPEREKGHGHQQSQQKHKPSVVVTESPQPSASKELPSASVAESEEEATASMEPKLTPEEDFKARRSEAIRAKALEITKHYRQDCETFRTVVKMLAAKEPSLDNLLQASLDKNLTELQQRCLDTLRSFIMELDKI